LTVLKWSLPCVLALLVACGGNTQNLPEEGPDVVAARFYEYISEAKQRGGAAPAREAFKLINSSTANINQHQFVEIIKEYPPGFRVELTGTEINDNKALVQIEYEMSSDFGAYKVNSEVALDLDPLTNSWVVDFTGENFGIGRSDLIGAEGGG
jgi:hypothetical protein